jgi:type IV pilus assembly protein PilC
VEAGFRQLASMLASGLSLLAALRTVAEQARRPRAAFIWRSVAEQIEQGGTFAAAVAMHRRVFTEHLVELVRVGENSGTLEAAVTRGAEHLERMRNLRMVVLNAVTYPAIVLVLAVGVTAFMLLEVIPKIQRFLTASGRALPAMTQALIDVSRAVQNAVPYTLIALVALVIAFILIRRWPPGRLALDGAALRIPLIGGILRMAGTARFSRGLGILLESGVTLLNALGVVERLVGNRALAARVIAAKESILRGGTLAAGLLAGREFLPMLGRAVAVGESAGTLSHVLSEVSRYHEGQLLVTVRRLSAFIEPAVILIVGGIVGFVYVSFFIALFSISGTIR